MNRNNAALSPKFHSNGAIAERNPHTDFRKYYRRPRWSVTGRAGLPYGSACTCGSQGTDRYDNSCRQTVQSPSRSKRQRYAPLAPRIVFYRA